MHSVYPSNWGIRPALFHLGSIPVYAYPFFMFLAIVVSIILIRKNARQYGEANEGMFFVVAAALIGGILGAKVPVWIANWKMIIEHFLDPRVWLPGRTIVGGLVGGTIAVEWMKHQLGIKRRTGNVLAAPLALGMGIGRLGCFFQGCCYGIPTQTGWGVDFGDKILRHPTQLYEAFFCVVLAVILWRLQPRVKTPGLLFAILIIAYCSFRFLVEFLRAGHPIYFGLTSFQWASLAVVIYGFYSRILKGRVFYSKGTS